MHVIGYSERGAVNALCYELAYSGTPERLLEALLARTHFPSISDSPFCVTAATVLIEQSLSQFGDTDAVLLLQCSDGPLALFLEAKVKPSQTSSWSLAREYKTFLGGLSGKVSSSNLFVQLYHKVRFVEGLRRGGVPALEHGLPFPHSSSRRVRKIGANAVVLKAVDLIAPYLGRVRYVMLIPGEPAAAEAFFAKTLAQSPPPGYDDWDTRDYGYICWSEVERLCRDRGLVNTLRVLEHNRGQIY